MRNKFKYAICSLISLCLFSCGSTNGSNIGNNETQDNNENNNEDANHEEEKIYPTDIVIENPLESVNECAGTGSGSFIGGFSAKLFPENATVNKISRSVTPGEDSEGDELVHFKNYTTVSGQKKFFVISFKRRKH